MIFGDTMLANGAPVARRSSPAPTSAPVVTGPMAVPVQISGLSPESEKTLWNITVYGLVAAGVVAAGASGIAAAAALLIGRQAAAQIAFPVVLGLASGAAGAAAQGAVTLYALKKTERQESP